MGELTAAAVAHGMSEQDAKDLFDLMDENEDGEVTLDEWEAAINTFEGCDEESAHTTKLKAHDEGGGKKKVIKKKIKAAEKMAEAKERAHAAAAKKAAEQDGDDGKDVKARLACERDGERAPLTR